MRSTGAVTMVSTLGWNLNHGQRNVRLFEFGKTYQWNGAEPIESRVLTLGATGLAREKSVADNERVFAFADLKGDLDQIGNGWPVELTVEWRGKLRHMAPSRARRHHFGCKLTTRRRESDWSRRTIVAARL